MRDYSLGSLAGLRISAAPAAAGGSLALLVILAAAALVGLRWPPGQALLGGLLAVLLHWAGVFAHQFGHAWAARSTGFPMTGIRLGALGVLSTSLYPAEEPDLPAAVHIRRALGGPFASLLLALAAGIIAFLWRGGGPAWAAWLFFTLDNLVILGLGSFLPLGFTDGGTLMRWWGKHT